MGKELIFSSLVTDSGISILLFIWVNRLFIRHVIFLLLLVGSISPAASAERLIIGDFSSSSLADWDAKYFEGETRYTFHQLDGMTVLKAVSKDSASGLVKKKKIDLRKHPWLNWRWRIENHLGEMNEKQKAGDDYAARIYVIVSGGLFFWRTRALSYVWSSNLPRGEAWPNAFAGDKAMMVAVRTRSDSTSTWYTEKRNVYQDLKRYFGEEIRYIDAIAVMTDTDNSHGKAVSLYGDIFFTAD